MASAPFTIHLAMIEGVYDDISYTLQNFITPPVYKLPPFSESHFFLIK